MKSFGYNLSDNFLRVVIKKYDKKGMSLAYVRALAYCCARSTNAFFFFVNQAAAMSRSTTLSRLQSPSRV